MKEKEKDQLCALRQRNLIASPMWLVHIFLGRRMQNIFEGCCLTPLSDNGRVRNLFI
jgi:hypothetical protein